MHDAAVMKSPAACPVLVVEDDPDLREMMCVSLEHEEFAPHAARDGLDAFEQLRGRRVDPQVILLDLMMPRMDGVEFCRAREHDPALRDIPVVVLSASPFVPPPCLPSRLRWRRWSRRCAACAGTLALTPHFRAQTRDCRAETQIV